MANHRRRSGIWYHFEKIKSEKGTSGKCSYCQAEIKITGGATSNLRRHLSKKHVTVPLECGDMEKQPESRSRSPSVENDKIQFKEEPDDEYCENKEPQNYEDLSVADIDQESCRVYKQRSDVWCHFIAKSTTLAVCHHCKAKLSYKSRSTGNLLRHLRAKHVTLRITQKVARTRAVSKASASRCVTSASPSERGTTARVPATRAALSRATRSQSQLDAGPTTPQWSLPTIAAVSGSVRSCSLEAPQEININEAKVVFQEELDKASEIETTPQNVSQISKTRNNSQIVLENSVEEAVNISKTEPQAEKDDCELYAALLAIKLKRFPENEREKLMLDIDQMVYERKIKISQMPRISDMNHISLSSSSHLQEEVPVEIHFIEESDLIT